MWLLRTRTVTGFGSSQLLPTSGILQHRCHCTPCRTDSVVPVIRHPRRYQSFGCFIHSVLAILYPGKLPCTPQSEPDNECFRFHRQRIPCLRVLGTWMTAICIYFSSQHLGRGVAILFPLFSAWSGRYSQVPCHSSRDSVQPARQQGLPAGAARPAPSILTPRVPP